MSSVRRLGAVVVGLLTMLSALVVAAVPAVSAGHAPGIRTWDGVPDGGGTAADKNWSTAANWVGDVAPIAGDILEFPNAAGIKEAVNDFPAWTQFEAIRIVMHGLGAAGYTLSGNAVIVSSDITSTISDNSLTMPIRLGGDVTISGSGGGITLAQAVDLQSHRLTLAGSGVVRFFQPLSGTGPQPAIVVAGGASFRAWVTGTSTFTGGTRIDSGSLFLNRWSGDARWPGDVDLNGGTLAGTGTVTGAVRATEAGGSVEPAEEFGISVGSLRLNAASTFVGNNLFVPSGEVTLGGATLEIDRAWCYSCFVGVQRQLIHVGGTTPVAGTFAQMPQLARFERNGAWFEITYGGGSGNDVVVRVVEGPLPPERSGYWMLGAAGNVYRFGEAGDHGSAYPTAAANIAPSPTGSGYWLVNRDGVVFTFGDARWFGHAPALPTGEWVSSISPVPDGTGYWLFTTRGRVFAFGSARHYGDMSQMRLNAPVLGSVATPSGGGYYMVAADGGIFTFGDARFSGSMGGRRLNGPVTGLAPDPDGAGYWLVASDGGIFAFDATFRGSMGGQPLNRPVVGMVSYGDGYLMVASDGGIFNFSNKLFSGSLGATPPAQPIVAVAPLPR